MSQLDSPHPFAPRSSRRGEKAILWVLRTCGAISILTTIAIVAVLVGEAIPFFQEIRAVEFFTDTEWRPFTDVDSEQFRIGVLPLVSATINITLIAMLVAIPLGLATAMYLSEYAPRRIRRTLKPILEVLAGVPTVVLGFFALTFVTPLIRGLLGTDTVEVFNMASAGIVVGIMIIPTIASLSEDAMSAVPMALREGAYGLGATKRTVSLRIVFPAAISGITAAIILGISRAIGETMIVAIASGNLPNLTFDWFEGAQTMTGYIVQAVGGEAPRDSTTFRSIFGVGLLLFVMTLGLNVIAQRIVKKYREVY